MSLFITGLVLCAALLHATWNSLLKKGKDPLLDCMMISAGSLIICLCLLPFFPVLRVEALGYLAASVVVHVGYFFLLAQSYHLGELSRVYPLMRGLPPLFVMLVSLVFLKEPLHMMGIVAICTVAFGILLLEWTHKAPSYNASLVAVLTAVFITAYTLIDGKGAKASGSSTAFLLWLSCLQSGIFIALIMIRKRADVCLSYAKRYWRRGAVGAALSLFAYGLVLYAMTQAPISYVSALRETSVFFAGLIAVVWLKERFSFLRIISLLCIVVGVVLIKLVA